MWEHKLKPQPVENGELVQFQVLNQHGPRKDALLAEGCFKISDELLSMRKVTLLGVELTKRTMNGDRRRDVGILYVDLNFTAARPEPGQRCNSSPSGQEKWPWPGCLRGPC